MREEGLLMCFWRDVRTVRAYILIVACAAVWIIVATQDHARAIRDLTYLGRKLVGLEP